jgi:D-lactate dehydrogenase
VARIMMGFGAKVLAYDPIQNDDCLRLGVEYVSLEDLYRQSDIMKKKAIYSLRIFQVISCRMMCSPGF